MRRLALASILLATTALATQAADIQPKVITQQPASVPATWTGFYGGADLGVGWAKSNGAWDPLDNNYKVDPAYFGENPAGLDLSSTGATLGLHVGYNYQFMTKFVAGIEGDWSWADIKASNSQPWVRTSGTVRPGTLVSLSTKEDSLASIRLRGGYLVMPNLLVYGTGGFAWADVSEDSLAANEGSSHVGGAYYAPSSSSNWVGGYVFGGGVEYALTNAWSVRGEYLRYHLNTGNIVTALDSTGHYVGPPNGLFPSGFTRSDTDINAIRVGVSYKFLPYPN